MAQYACNGARRRYPIGVQSFEVIRRDGYVYVDKTAHVYELAHTSGKTFFLSRPRRFGKSLLISTLQAYFEGRRDLFEGLAVFNLEQEWAAYPVVRVDLSPVKARDAAELDALIDQVLRSQEERFGPRDPQDVTYGSRLRGIVERAWSCFKKPVVLLIDEYDAPLLNVAGDSQMLAQFREVMREFYAPVKALDDRLRFTFITGITKFSQLSVFSELNNIRNISMEPQFADICGVTEEELHGRLASDVELLAGSLGLAADETYAALKRHYDGYHFSRRSPDVYNPFSLMSAFGIGEIGSYWFGSGTPTFLLALMERAGWDLASVDGCEVPVYAFDAPVEDTGTPLPMLYQSGYLTIKAFDALNESYTLGIPNREVARGLAECLVSRTAPMALIEHNLLLNRMANYLRAGEVVQALEGLRSYLAGVPYHLGSRDERGFQTVFYLVFDLLGAKVQTEFKTATGRVDAVVRTADSLYVMEFKYDKPARVALEQIDAKGYMVPFERDGRRLVKVGVSFSSETRTIEEWLIEEA